MSDPSRVAHDAPETPAQTPQPGMEAGPKSLLRVAAVGDLHVNEAASRPYRDLFERVGEDADVLCLCGDLVNFGKTWLTGALPEFWLFALGALFIVVTLLLPKGIMGLWGQIRDRSQARKAQGAKSGTDKAEASKAGAPA